MGGTATADIHYLAKTGTLAFTDGEMSKTFTVTVLDDQATSGNHTVDLVLTNPTGGLVLDTRSTATLWVVDVE